MKIEVYSNNRSVKPVTAWESVADMYNFLEENKNIAAVCAKIRETGDKSFKSQLPAMMPMGRVGDKTRKKENCVPTGLVMLDIDSPLPAFPQGGGGAMRRSPLRLPQGGGGAMRRVLGEG